ncbi:MAG: hydrogenase nickel incorporation protein HypB [Desulfurivibrio sp.]|nr:hydrogenase nickel incorporation protein HypB [Desulfurivibrio sp.]
MGSGVAKTGQDHAGDHAADHAGDQAGEGGRRLAVEQEVLAKNIAQAEHNREHFARHRILALNLVSSPGAGKTTLLERTILELNGRLPLAVIEGDQQTLLDAQRIERTGVPVVQVNTGAGCHLDAEMIHRALHRLELSAGSRLLIENVGNLVCPAMFDLGEAAKVVIISPTEGEDKPLKYPAMFTAASICVINKIDLLPYLDFDLALCRQYLQQVNPDLQIFTLSAKSGEGLADWLEWLATAQPPGAAAV